ncbi:NERD domain-containing protein [Bacteroidales bacterium AH-315-N07]|nr:NERD domain-containing protein [Bacteroidales bacterium AH-315-N07]
MQKFYSSNTLTNPGEQAVDAMFDLEFRYDPDDWYIYYAYRLGKHSYKKYGECDYLIVNSRGIMVLEVKGGQILFENHKFYYAPQPPYKDRQEFKEDPFLQLDGNVESIVRYLNQKNIYDVYVGGAVVFPQSTFNYKGVSYDNFYHLTREKQSFRDFLIDAFDKLKKKSKWQDSSLNKLKRENILKLLAPTVMPDEYYAQMIAGDKAVKLRAEENFKILDGLAENKRLLVQGPPGSGKSKYAFKFIQKKVESDVNIKGLYICWNELLGAFINYKLKEADLNNNIQAWPLFPYVKKLLGDAGHDPDELNFQTSEKINQFLSKAIDTLKIQNKLPEFDFIVIDEAQDVFHKGIDIILDKFLNKGSDGIEKGEYALFYDLLQAFDKETSDTLSYIKFCAAHYRLKKSFRAIGGVGINHFIKELDSGEYDFKKDYGQDMKFYSYNKYADIPRIIKKFVNPKLAQQHFTHDELIILFTSNLIGEKDGKPKVLEETMRSDHDFELLLPENIARKNKKIKYTTALKFKGLDKNVVFVVVDDLMNEKINTQYQLFIGATRPRLKLFVLLNEIDL